MKAKQLLPLLMLCTSPLMLGADCETPKPDEVRGLVKPLALHPYTATPSSGIYDSHDNTMPFLLNTAFDSCLWGVTNDPDVQETKTPRMFKFAGINRLLDQCSPELIDATLATFDSNYTSDVFDPCTQTPPPLAEAFSNLNCRVRSSLSRRSFAQQTLAQVLPGIAEQPLIEMSEVQPYSNGDPADEWSIPVPPHENVTSKWEPSINPFHNLNPNIYNGCFVSTRSVVSLGAVMIGDSRVYWRGQDELYSPLEAIQKEIHADGRARGPGLAVEFESHPEENLSLATVSYLITKQCGDWPKNPSADFPTDPGPRTRPSGGWIEEQVYVVRAIATPEMKFGFEFVPYVAPRPDGIRADARDMIDIDFYPLLDSNGIDLELIASADNAWGWLDFDFTWDAKLAEKLVRDAGPLVEGALRVALATGFADLEAGKLGEVATLAQTVLEATVPGEHEFCGLAPYGGPGPVMIHAPLDPNSPRSCAGTPIVINTSEQ